jgi:hypothetical protein
VEGEAVRGMIKEKREGKGEEGDGGDLDVWTVDETQT